MPDSKDVRRWIQYAKEDYEAALMILLAHPRNASFDFQQSAEKYLKAVLIAQGLEPDRTHDLVILLLCIDANLT
jgi:HEPN domain-containing protein